MRRAHIFEPSIVMASLIRAPGLKSTWYILPILSPPSPFLQHLLPSPTFEVPNSHNVQSYKNPHIFEPSVVMASLMRGSGF